MSTLQVFGYGSLMFEPPCPDEVQMRPAVVHGFVRDVNKRSHGRGCGDDEAVLAASKRNISLTPRLINFRQRLIASDSSVFPPTPGARFLPALWATGWDFVAGYPEGEVDIQRKRLPAFHGRAGETCSQFWCRYPCGY